MGKLHKALNKAETRRGGGSSAVAQHPGSSGPATGPVGGEKPYGASSVGARARADADPRLVAIAEPDGIHAEQYRVLAKNLLEAAAAEGHKAFAVTSATASEGRSVTCANLACVLAEDTTKKGVLIDADFRRPSIHKLIGVDNQRGLADYLAGGALLEMALQRSFLPNLSLIPAGQTPANPTEVLASQRLDDLVARLRRDYDWVLIDAPSLAGGEEGSSVAGRADAVLLVVRMTRTPREVAAAAVETLQRSGANVLGTVLTSLPV